MLKEQAHGYRAGTMCSGQDTSLSKVKYVQRSMSWTREAHWHVRLLGTHERLALAIDAMNRQRL